MMERDCISVILDSPSPLAKVGPPGERSWICPWTCV